MINSGPRLRFQALGAIVPATALLAGCVAVPVAPAQIPYVAVPGANKTQVQFQQDDSTCRVDLGRYMMASPPEQVGSVSGGATAQAQAPQGQFAPGQAVTGQPYANQPVASEPPGVAYLRCMTAHGNLVQPLPQAAPPLYAYYNPYPVYVGGYGDYYPWLYGGGLYAGYGFGGWGWGGPGWRGGYGWGGGYGWRGGWGGGWGGGWHEGWRGGYGGGFGGGYGGFRGGGGFRR